MLSVSMGFVLGSKWWVIGPLAISKVDEPVSAPTLTPQMQCAMRTEQTKNLKRGRKPKGKKTGKAETSPKRKLPRS